MPNRNRFVPPCVPCRFRRAAILPYAASQHTNGSFSKLLAEGRCVAVGSKHHFVIPSGALRPARARMEELAALAAAGSNAVAGDADTGDALVAGRAPVTIAGEGARER
ncbi:hypothetical protein GN244_ATG02864 [Phytophthora infestans]|uniref:Uncharacterized protein n=1 Tax=Phytophthora infestans TaxID=4787 RepID=A0A833SAX9_PHYIN|nr:hypothetical protein GN244_ATG02864 [Phytophthora infestans]